MMINDTYPSVEHLIAAILKATSARAVRQVTRDVAAWLVLHPADDAVIRVHMESLEMTREALAIIAKEKA